MQYCVLYEQGYTSLGDMRTTVQNSTNKTTGRNEYRPAYLLEDVKKEREETNIGVVVVVVVVYIDIT